MPLQSQYVLGLYQDVNPTKNRCHHNIGFPLGWRLCHIWRIRNTKAKRFTFNQQHSSGFIQRRLDHIFVSSGLQKFLSKTDILTPISTDHSPVLFNVNAFVKPSLSRDLSFCMLLRGFYKSFLVKSSPLKSSSQSFNWSSISLGTSIAFRKIFISAVVFYSHFWKSVLKKSFIWSKIHVY